MRILVSWLRDFVDIAASPEEIAKTMSVRGFAVEGLEQLGNGDAVIDFEVTGNRPDCMCVMGMAREVATAYRLPIRRPVVRGASPGAPPATDSKPPSDEKPPSQ
jgi:phenylalanyl-tRNA synthetase beta chain